MVDLDESLMSLSQNKVPNRCGNQQNNEEKRTYGTDISPNLSQLTVVVEPGIYQLATKGSIPKI